MLLRNALPRFLLLSLVLSPVALLSGCGQTGPLYLPEKPVDETVTELDVTESGPSDAVDAGATAGLDDGIEAGRDSGLEDGIDGASAAPLEGSARRGGVAVDDEVLIESDDADKAGH